MPQPRPSLSPPSRFDVVLRRVAAIVVLTAAALLAVAPRAARAEPSALEVPPVGGLTQGVAGTSDPAALAAAQAFDVETVSVLVAATQRWLVYIPGAPGAASTLTTETLDPDAIVTVRRSGTRVGGVEPPAPPADAPAVSGDGAVFDEPPIGGLVQGMAGTNDPATLVARQRFTVESVSLLDVPSQTWLVYVPSAPTFASRLRTGMLDASSIVTVRRLSPPPVSPADVDVSAEAVMLAGINDARIVAGLAPLALDTTMVDVARAHSRDMIARNFFAHVNPDGEDPFDRMRAAGIAFGYAAENIVTGQDGASAHAALMASPPHRANILGTRYRRVGIGAITRPGGGITVTEVFAD